MQEKERIYQISHSELKKLENRMLIIGIKLGASVGVGLTLFAVDMAKHTFKSVQQHKMFIDPNELVTFSRDLIIQAVLLLFIVQTARGYFKSVKTQSK